MSDRLKRTSSYYYDLPSELIAQYPVAGRSESRLLYLHRNNGSISHHYFHEITGFLQPSDILVINRTRVIPARLLGSKPSGAQVEVFLLNQKTDTNWECLVRPGRKIRKGSRINFSGRLSAEVKEELPEGERLIEFSWQGDFWQILEEVGSTPLPPYIRREAEAGDRENYQTVYANQQGSVAAPTAGLHFTAKLLQDISIKGIEILEVILHIGLGTFRPVSSENILDHRMHSEFCTISAETADKINLARDQHRRIIAVGTTTTRTLESFARNGILTSGSHWTDIFLYPGYEFKIINGLITNFHMPESTLLMLVAAFAGYDNIMNAYQTAVNMKYRFFSYGDAMLIL
ncbi:MAG: tRNA preQ1(34) S-adenosylmethionine ribosyltransferase-isomerase QueA [Candidatus Cloacimonetes bacterium]|nr:tRNA preQ1(34) S-adenosylmethionine ribosyltransferase-isomerase QueA [Candidatus Cloacimonadota bacterium]